MLEDKNEYDGSFAHGLFNHVRPNASELGVQTRDGEPLDGSLALTFTTETSGQVFLGLASGIVHHSSCPFTSLWSLSCSFLFFLFYYFGIHIEKVPLSLA